MHPALQTLFERHVARSFDKQLVLADVIGSREWHFDLDRGTITFGGEFTWPVQVLGIVSEQTGTWLWAWAITATKVPPDVLKVAEAMRRLGQTKGIRELVGAEQPRGESTGTLMSMIASGVFRADAFYRAPYPGGAAFLLIADPAFPAPDERPTARIPNIFPQAVSRFGAKYPINHRRALLGYLKDYGLESHAEGDDLIVRNGTGPTLRARFEGDRLTGIEHEER
jgi:hypothetical protein